MSLLYYAYVVLLLFSAALAFATIAFVWRRRDARAVGTFLALLACCTVWILTQILGTLATDEASATFLLCHVRLTAVSFVPVFLLRFAADYTGQNQLVRSWRTLAFLVVPVLTQVFNYTSLRRYFVPELVLVRVGPFWFMDQWTDGPWFAVHLWYSYALICIALIMLFSFMIRSMQIFRSRVAVVFLGTAAPFAASIATNFGPRLGLDLTSVGFGFTFAIWAATLFRDVRFLGVVPIALDAVFARMNEGVVILDHRGRVADANPAACEMLSLVRGEIVGRMLEDVSGGAAQVAAHARNGLGRREEFAIGQRCFDFSSSPLLETSGRTVGYLLALHDVTERSRLIESLDAYARAVAHDLKNPLGVVVGYLDLIHTDANGHLEGELSEFLSSALGMCTTMSAIIDELLLLARLRNGREVSCERLKMASVVAEVRNRLGTIITRSTAALKVPKQWPAAYGHAGWVAEVWANYISNAIKYGGTPPRVELGACEDRAGMVRFWVRDNGEGLDAAQRAQLFQEFSRLSPSRAEGNGLGLSIVRQIVERLGGSVGVDSSPGQGSTFWFTLPSAAPSTEDIESVRLPANVGLGMSA